MPFLELIYLRRLCVPFRHVILSDVWGVLCAWPRQVIDWSVEDFSFDFAWNRGQPQGSEKCEFGQELKGRTFF